MQSSTFKSTSLGAISGLANLIIAAIFLMVICPTLSPAHAQEKGVKGAQMSVGGFLDEDGDGFNDLLPDSDGDGVPDALDPNFKGRRADSIFMSRHMHRDSIGMMHNMMGNDPMQSGMGMHGESGQYGPGDSTMHGGMHGDGCSGGGGMGGGKITPGGGANNTETHGTISSQASPAGQNLKPDSRNSEKSIPGDPGKSIGKHDNRGGK